MSVQGFGLFYFNLGVPRGSSASPTLNNGGRSFFWRRRVVGKKCVGCGESKPAEQFQACSSSADKLDRYCKKCRNAKTQAYRLSDLEGYRDRRKGQARGWRSKNPDKSLANTRRARAKVHPDVFKDYNLRTNYGISIEEYNRMAAAQKGVCKICARPEKGTRRLAVDHCHTTSAVRGLLCRECNLGLGYFKDSITTLRLAVLYLENIKP
jgi:hypothetical protein